MINLGPSAPFIGIATLGMVAACLIVAGAMLSCRGKRKWKQINSRHNSVVVLLLMAVTFALWGSSTGRGGPHGDGGTVGYTNGGMLDYLSVISYQPVAEMPWSHGLSVRPLALLGTIGLNAVAVVVALVASRWIGRGVQNHAVNRSGEVGRF